MSFQETVLIEFRGSDNVSPVINRLNKSFEALGKNKALQQIKNDLNSYITDVNKWKAALQGIEKQNPELKTNANFQGLVQDVEKLQKGFKIAEKESKGFEKSWDKHGEGVNESVATAMRNRFNKSKELLELFNKTQEVISPKGIDASAEDITKSVGLTEKPKETEPKPSEKEPKKDEKDDSAKKEAQKEVTKETSNVSKDLKSVDTSVKKLDNVITKVINSLERFNKALSNATGGSGGKGTPNKQPSLKPSETPTEQTTFDNKNNAITVGNVAPLDKETHNATAYNRAVEDLNKSTTTLNTNISHTAKGFRESTSSMLPAIRSSNNLTRTFGETSLASSSLNLSLKPSDLSTTAGSFDKLSSSLSAVTQGMSHVNGIFTQFFAVIGSGNAIMDMLTNASMRQTNQIMLNANRSRESASKTYDFIQDLVVRLPGNDDFLNQILVQTASMNPDMGTEDLGKIGVATANYYMLAKAKGQNNYETERELRSYLLTGETLAFRNSVLSSEIKEMKKGHTVYERSIKLQEAMQRVGMDSIATYDSYANALEELRGHFQKAFADLGEVLVAVVHPFMKLYNSIDNLLGTRLSQFIIASTVSLSLMFTAVIMLTNGIYLLGRGFLGFLNMVSAASKITTFISSVGGLRNALNSTRTSLETLMGVENAAIIVELRATVFKFLGMDASYKKAMATRAEAEMENHLKNSKEASRQAEMYYNLAKEEGAAQSYYKAMATDFEKVAEEEKALADAAAIERTELLIASKEAETMATETNTASLWGNISAKLKNTAQTIYNTVAIAYETIVVGDETIAVQLQTSAEEGNTLAKMLLRGYAIREAVVRAYNTVNTWIETGAIDNNTRAEMTNLGMKIRQLWNNLKVVASKVADWVATNGLTVATWLLNGALAILNVLLSPIGLTIMAIVGAVLLLIKGFEWLGQSFGWWNDIGGMFEAIQSGIGRVWDAFMNSEPVQQIITTFQNFAYTIETLFNFIGSIGGGLWELIFGVGQNEDGTLDIVGILLEIGGAIGNFLYWLSSFEEILAIFDAIGSAIAWVLETWNDFVDSAEMQSLIKAFQDIRAIFGEAFGEIFEAFQEVGEAFGSIFEDDSSTKEATDGVNVLLELLKVLASIIKTVVIPPLKAVADTVKWIADGIKWVADGVAWLEGKESPTAQKPQNIANTNGGYNSYYTDLLSGGASYDYSQTQGMTQSYNYNDTQKTSSVFNIFNEGSVQADARNMSAKDVQKMFTGAFGYNKARGTEGILN